MLVKPLSASGYQKECSVQTAWLRAFWLSAAQDAGKLTSSPGFAASFWAANAPPESGKSATTAVAIPYKRERFMANPPEARPASYEACGGLLLWKRLNQNPG